MHPIGSRRRLTLAAVAAFAALPATRTWASGGLLGSLSDADATAGLKSALERGALAAVASLGRPDGFWGNERLRIPLPGMLADAAKLGRALGQGKRFDELHLALNRAAEAAVPEAKALLQAAVKSMTVVDAKNILTGGDTSVTQFFRSKTEQPLHERFLPIVTRVVGRTDLAQRTNDLAAKLPVKGEAIRIEPYVTTRALDALYTLIGEEERSIRRDPAGTGSAILRRVFGGLK
jgi:hypothetical protein